MKERALAKLERDRLAARVAQLEASSPLAAPPGGDSGGESGAASVGGGVTQALRATAAAPVPARGRGASKGPTGGGSATRGLTAAAGATTAAPAAPAVSGKPANTRASGVISAPPQGLGGPGAVDSRFPADDAPNPYLSLVFEPARAGAYKAEGPPHPAHAHPVSALCFHPSKPVVVTASDDATWRMWAMPDAELIMSGEGHR
jgi:sperm-associated antigen 16 protein